MPDLTPAAEQAIHVDYRSTRLAVGQTVTYWDGDDRRLYEGQIQLLTDEQAVVGYSAHVIIIDGEPKLPGLGGSGPGEVRYTNLVVQPATPTDPGESIEVDGAWGEVWLHGKWQYLTSKMTTPQREYAADAVARWSAALAAIDKDPNRGEPEGLRWWREDR